MSDDVDIRSGGLVAVDTAALRALSRAMTLLAASLDDACGALTSAATASLEGGLWVPAPTAQASAAQVVATDLAGALDTLADVYDLAETEALYALGGAREVDPLRLAAARMQADTEVAAAAARLSAEWIAGRHGDIEDQMRAGSLLFGTVPGVVPGLYALLGPALTLLTGTVRHVGRGTISAAAPPLRPVGATASVVELSRHPATGADAAPRGLTDLLDRMPGEDGLDDARVRVEEYRYSSGAREFVVYIAGTRAPADDDEPWDMASNLQLYFGEESSSYLAVEQALAAAGAVAGDRLHVVGHSQGAMIGAHLARQGGFDVVTEIGFGSPVQAELPDGTLTVSVRHTDDPVAALSVGGIPGVSGSSDSTVIEREADPAPRWSDAGVAVHQLDAYRETAATADASLDPRMQAVRDRLAPLAAATVVTSTVYGAHRDPARSSDRRRRSGGGGE